MIDSSANAAFFARYDALLARWPVDVESIDIPGRYGTTHVNACGPAGAPPVVLVHGGRATSAVWFGNVAALARYRRVFAIDGIGDAGRSIDDGEPITATTDLMRWFDETLDALGVREAALVGHSIGAWATMQYALHAPDRVTQLALLDPADCLSPTTLRFKVRAIPLIMGRAPDRWRRFFIWETQGHRIEPEFLDLWASTFQVSWSSGVKLPLPKRPSRAVISTFRTPTLVVVAGRSRQNSARRLARLARLLPDVRIVTLPDATHFTLPQEYPDEINAAVDELLGAGGRDSGDPSNRQHSK